MKEEIAIYARRLHAQVSELLGTKNFHIAGGALRTCVENFDILSMDMKNNANDQVPIYSKDVDCFFGNVNEYNLALNTLKESGYEISKERANSVLMEKPGYIKYDLVYLSHIYNGKSIIDDFDFTNCCISIGEEGLVTSTSFWEDVEKRKLVINKLKIPYHSIARAGKFMKKGYTISDEDKIYLFDNAAQSPVGPYEEDEYEQSKVQVPTVELNNTKTDVTLW